MLSKCANPDCQTSFLYLHEGRLFRWEKASSSPATPFLKKTGSLEYFWLCGHCASDLTLVFKEAEGVAVERKARAKSAGL